MGLEEAEARLNILSVQYSPDGSCARRLEVLRMPSWPLEVLAAGSFWLLRCFNSKLFLDREY